jgi:hypothetical protein
MRRGLPSDDAAGLLAKQDFTQHRMMMADLPQVPRVLQRVDLRDLHPHADPCSLFLRDIIMFFINEVVGIFLSYR